MQGCSWYQIHLCMLINGLGVMLVRRPGESGGPLRARGTASVLPICYGNKRRLLQHRANLRDAGAQVFTRRRRASLDARYRAARLALRRTFADPERRSAPPNSSS